MVGRRLFSRIFGSRERAELLHALEEKDHEEETVVAKEQRGEPFFYAVPLLDWDKEAVDALIQAGANVNGQGEDGETPLYWASLRGYAKVVDRLLRARADVNLAHRYGYTPLYAASSNGHARIVDLLLRAGALVNLTTKYGETPLFTASAGGHAEVVDRLLRAGADVHLLDKDGQSAVHAACLGHSHNVLRVLLPRSGSLLYTADKDGCLPLHVALLRVSQDDWRGDCSDEALKTLQVLIEHGMEWDSTCEKIANQDINDNDKWRIQAPAIRLCFERWKQEHKHGLSLTDVPVEEVKRGIDATKTYLAEITASDNVTAQYKICVVGPSGWGKTSLIKSLTSEEPSLVHIDDRTIGIDHFKLKFVEKLKGLKGIKQHEVTFWDFAGQDAYQGAHSLFFSARTLYIVCIDLESFVLACMQAQLMTDTESEFDHWMNDFIEMKVLKWIRVICARQPDAEFVYVATKKDRVGAADLEGPKGALAVLRALLENVEVIEQEMKSACEKITRMRGKSSKREQAARLPISHLGDSRLAAFKGKPRVQMIVTSCLTTKDVDAFKERIQRAIMKSNRGYPMPHKYSRVRDALLQMRTGAAFLATDERLHSTFVVTNELISILVKTVNDLDQQNRRAGRWKVVFGSYLNESTCLNILRTLRDLGDILWYDHIDDKWLRNKIILDPMLMIDLVRQVFDHKHTAEIMTHYTLKELDFWKHLEGTDGMLSMKRVLQHFQLVYPMTGEMQADSDLIVPAYWQSNTCAFWMFGGGDVRFGKGIHREDVAVRVHWEFQFVNNYPHTLFDNVVVASCSASYKRDVGPDWIMYMVKDKCACRLVLKRAVYSHHWIIHLEAIESHSANDDDKEHLWDCFLLLSTSLEKVIRGYPGVVVTRYAQEDTEEDVEVTRNTLDSLRRSSKLSVPSRKWMPPQRTWEEYLAFVNL